MILNILFYYLLLRFNYHFMPVHKCQADLFLNDYGYEFIMHSNLLFTGCVTLS